MESNTFVLLLTSLSLLTTKSCGSGYTRCEERFIHWIGHLWGVVDCDTAYSDCLLRRYRGLFPESDGINGRYDLTEEVQGEVDTKGDLGEKGNFTRRGKSGRDGLKREVHEETDSREKGEFTRRGESGRGGLKGEVHEETDSREKGEFTCRGESGRSVGLKGEVHEEADSREKGEFTRRGESGRGGLKGEVHEEADSIEKGEFTRRGESGRGGLKGEVHEEAGCKGKKGEFTRRGVSAFAVYKTTSQTISTWRDTATFNAARVNIGNHFDLKSNRFTCLIPGTYFFTYSAYVTAQSSPDIYLMKDGSTVTRARNECNKFNQIGSSTMLELEAGNQVWLRFSEVGETIDGVDGECQFSGFLLYEHYSNREQLLQPRVN